MQRISIALIAAVMLLGNVARADEGMWLPFLLGRNYEDMKKHGLRLTQDQIYSINQSSLKDAIISFGGFCTGEIISKNGLILTNHHCGYDAIAESSTPEHNYLDNGFWAKNYGQEIPIQGLTASFIIRMEDVSETINKALTKEMSEDERKAKIAEISKILVKDATEGTEYEAFVRDFYEGNEFYLFVKQTYRDVRLVGTPPQSAGKFGGDTDNWMWPRHTADFSMFRIYADGNNKPADFSKENKPYSPKHSLPISLKGVKEGDFSMVFGFPGSTDRYLSSWGVRQAVEKEQPKRVDIRAKKLEIMRSYMDKDVDLRLKYSSKYAQVANYWKYFIGQTEQVKKNNVIGKKQALEADFTKFAGSNADYANVLKGIADAYAVSDNYVYINAYQSEFIYTVDANVNAFRFSYWINAVKNESPRADAFKMRIIQLTQEYFEKANMDLEFETVKEVFKMYVKDIPADQQGELTKKVAAKGDKGINKYMAKVRKKSIFFNKSAFEAFAEDASQEKLEKDPLYALVMDIVNANGKISAMEEVQKAEQLLDKSNRLFVKGIREMKKDKVFYPNANSTMRLTYGNVLPYNPKDGVHYNYITTLDGVMEKEDASSHEFMVDARIKELWKAKDYGQYANADGNLVVNFLSNNDITGGNSGSPVINGDGELIGTAFDGNWEAMSGDIFFEQNIQRTISCDIRYVLWLVDKCYGATNLIDEMELVK